MPESANTKFNFLRFKLALVSLLVNISLKLFRPTTYCDKILASDDVKIIIVLNYTSDGDVVYDAFTLPDNDTDTETDTYTDNDKFYTSHFCRSLFRSICRAV